MEIEIIRALSNKKFVRKKQEQYYMLSWLTKRIWLASEIPVSADGSVIYELSLADGTAVEGTIHEARNDASGFCIVFCLHFPALRNDIESLIRWKVPKGRAVLREIFNPHADRHFKLLILDEKNNIPYLFNKARLEYARSDAGITLNFAEGALRDRGIRLELSEIVSEKGLFQDSSNQTAAMTDADSKISSKYNSLDSFSDGNIHEVYFRKAENGDYLLHIDNSRSDHIFPEGTDFLSGYVKPQLIRHTQIYTIRFRKLAVCVYNNFQLELAKRGIQCDDLNGKYGPGYSETLRERWKQAFLTNADTEGIYIEQYLWHVFSYERLPAKKGEDAVRCLKNEPKTRLYLFLNSTDFQQDICYELNHAGLFEGDLINCYDDVYITDEHFTWTYVRTHEDGWCGPYFYKKAI